MEIKNKGLAAFIQKYGEDQALRYAEIGFRDRDYRKRRNVTQAAMQEIAKQDPSIKRRAEEIVAKQLGPSPYKKQSA